MVIQKFKYIHHEDFTGSIKGINRFLKPGDILKEDDIFYFQQNYPDRIINITEISNEKEILNLIKNQSEKIDLLMDFVKTQPKNTIYIKDDIKSIPNGTIQLKDETIKLKEDSIAKHVKIDSNIESQGNIGEIKSEGHSVSDKIQLLKKRLSDKS